MTPVQYQRATEVFEAALQYAADEREAFITRTEGDADVARAVRRMLAQHDAPAFDLDSAALNDGIHLASLDPGADRSPRASRMPSRIGQYEIIGVLGEGGSSIVYRARQAFPDRIVALKILRGGALSPAALRRFHAEVQTLAELSHPNIAQVYQADSFIDADGSERPYFAMELVEGLPLTDFAKQHRLNVARRVRLMIDVCRAVQHAHLRGVIHRDLKPGNTLVLNDPADGLKPDCPSAQPEVLDFGIARATDLDVTRATLAAEAGRIVGTLPYMSPEQLAGDAAAIDLRSDVYALGVVLFELLADQLPHAISGEMSLPQTAHALAQNEPRRLGDINRSLRGELEVIAATAMERDRDRRYQSADALAGDLLAHLEHRPIRARSPGPIVRARKWLRRHPSAATAAVVVLLSLVAIAALARAQQRRVEQATALDLALMIEAVQREVTAYAADLDSSRRREIEILDVRNRLYRYNPPQQALELEQRERELLQAKNDHDAALHRILNLIVRAQRQGAPEEGIRRLQARVYFARVREAEAAGDRFARSTYLQLARQNDPTGEVAREMLERFPLTVRSDPPGAQAHLFRLVEQSEIMNEGEPRLVPVAWRGEQQDIRPGAGFVRTSAWAEGRFALRVVDGQGVLNDDDIVMNVALEEIRDRVFVLSAGAPASATIKPGDRLISTDGNDVHGLYDAYPPLLGVNARAAPAVRTFVFQGPITPSAGVPTPVTLQGASLEELAIRVGDAAQLLNEVGGPVQVWQRGQQASMILPPGLSFRVTAKPMLVSDLSLLGTTPVSEAVPIERGRYILLLIKDGFEPLRIPLDVHEGGMIDTMKVRTWELLPRGTTPAGFVRATSWENSTAPPFWIMEREITIGEYLEFLNDPEVLARIDASTTPILYPRSGSFMECGRETEGQRRFTTGAEMRADDPVLAVNWYDAMAYVKWRNQRGHADGSLPADMHFDLPTHQEWLAAWGCSGANQYPWGTHYRAQWASSNYARQQPAPEPVMRFPIDESNVGVFDLAGSVSEWLNAWWIEERDQREVAGGSWGHGGGFNYNNMFMLYGQNGQTATVTNGTVGFRLVMRKKDAGAP